MVFIFIFFTIIVDRGGILVANNVSVAFFYQLSYTKSFCIGVKMGMCVCLSLLFFILFISSKLLNLAFN